MQEFGLWVIRVADATVTSKHSVLATELDGEMVEVTSPDPPSDLEPGCVVVMGKASDLRSLVSRLASAYDHGRDEAATRQGRFGIEAKL